MVWRELAREKLKKIKRSLLGKCRQCSGFMGKVEKVIGKEEKEKR